MNHCSKLLRYSTDMTGPVI